MRHAARRHAVHVVALNQEAALPDSDALAEAISHLSVFCAGIDVFRMPVAATERLRFATAVASYFHPDPYEVNWLRSGSMHAHLRELARTRSFDVVHVDTIGLLPYARWFADGPVVLNHHNVESQLVRRRAGLDPSLARRIYLKREAGKIQRLERDHCGQVAINLVVSELDALRLRAVAPSAPTAVVENGVDVTYFRPGISGCAEAGGMLFAGTLSLYANRDAVRYLLRQIWPALLADNPARRIAIVGRHPEPETVSAARDPRVTVTGAVADVRPFFDSASIYLCPIRDGGGTRLKVLDALAMGKPLVATALAVEGLSVREEEHYLRAETPADYVAQVGRLEKDPDLRRRLAATGRDLVERRYAWEAIGQKLETAWCAHLRQSASAVIPLR